MSKILSIIGSILGISACIYTGVLIHNYGGFGWPDKWWIALTYLGIYGIVFVVSLLSALLKYRRLLISAAVVGTIYTLLGLLTFTTSSILFVPGVLFVLMASILK